ncbi:MAG: hypothetical protein RL685_657 [Pseudomonadota bacterium]
MRFRRLEVSHFRAVDQAQLELAPGLNVLYGPNDLGKSTLGMALRAVLLLPAESSAQREFLPWHSQELPRVLLTFETESAVWRIGKTFGTGSSAQALLESSLDGQRFREEARGRAADSRLRELLRWGLEAPGGRSGGRGLPESFLSHVLLASQGTVVQILERTLTDDREGSGRERLHEALQALAQHPLFQRVLAAVEARVESAFTPTGRRKTGQASPFAPVRQAISELGQELERIEHQRRESDDVQQRLARLHQERLEAEARTVQLRERVALAQLATRELESQRALRERALVAERSLERQRASARELRELGRELELARAASASQAALLERGATALTTLETALEQAETALQRLGSEASRQARQARLAQLESERGALEQRRAVLGRLRDLEQTLATSEATWRAELDALEQAERQQRELVEQLGREEQSQARTRALETVGRWREAEERAARARQAEQAATELRASAALARERASALRLSTEEWTALTPELLAQLRELDRQLGVARARVEVGLSVAISLPAGRAAAISLDGAPATAHAAAARPVLARARGQVRLQLDDDVEVVATAGEPEQRARAEQLAADWAELAQPWLRRAGVSDLAALARHAEQRAAERRDAAAALEQAATLEARAAEKHEQCGELGRWQGRAAELAAELGAVPCAELLAELTTLGAGWEAELGRRSARAEREQRRLQAAQLAQSTTLARLAARVADAQRARDGAQAERVQTLGALGPGAAEPSDGWLQRELGALERAALAAARAYAQEESGFRAELSALERNRDEARAALARGRSARETALVASRAAREAELALEVRFRERQAHVEPAALAVAEAEWERARAELASLPELPTASAEALAASQSELEREDVRLGQLVLELRRAEGALGQVGGDVVAQRESQTRDALERARSAERELELEYDAYQLLAKTLRSTENEEGAHLGRSLSEPVSERFQRLTDGRYGRVALDAALGFEGITIAGQPRSYRELSEGTREQLATIFRLCVAEQLHTALVLDDQLAQTHRERVAWFRSTLRESAGRIQILVLTARPDDYLSSAELLDAGSSLPGAPHVINLEQVIRRARYG